MDHIPTEILFRIYEFCDLDGRRNLSKALGHTLSPCKKLGNLAAIDELLKRSSQHLVICKFPKGFDLECRWNIGMYRYFVRKRVKATFVFDVDVLLMPKFSRVCWQVEYCSYTRDDATHIRQDYVTV